LVVDYAFQRLKQEPKKDKKLEPAAKKAKKAKAKKAKENYCQLKRKMKSLKKKIKK
jgi:hypothetical protein